MISLMMMFDRFQDNFNTPGLYYDLEYNYADDNNPKVRLVLTNCHILPLHEHRYKWMTPDEQYQWLVATMANNLPVKGEHNV